jgi:hypothetical protein
VPKVLTKVLNGHLRGFSHANAADAVHAAAHAGQRRCAAEALTRSRASPHPRQHAAVPTTCGPEATRLTAAYFNKNHWHFSMI